jgi:hypothetical protein
MGINQPVAPCTLSNHDRYSLPFFPSFSIYYIRGCLFSHINWEGLPLLGGSDGGPHSPPDCVHKGPPNRSPPPSPLREGDFTRKDGEPSIGSCSRSRHVDAMVARRTVRQWWLYGGVLHIPIQIDGTGNNEIVARLWLPCKLPEYPGKPR